MADEARSLKAYGELPESSEFWSPFVSSVLYLFNRVYFSSFLPDNCVLLQSE